MAGEMADANVFFSFIFVVLSHSQYLRLMVRVAEDYCHVMFCFIHAICNGVSFSSFTNTSPHLGVVTAHSPREGTTETPPSLRPVSSPRGHGEIRVVTSSLFEIKLIIDRPRVALYAHELNFPNIMGRQECTKNSSLVSVPFSRGMPSTCPLWETKCCWECC